MQLLVVERDLAQTKAKRTEEESQLYRLQHIKASPRDALGT